MVSFSVGAIPGWYNPLRVAGKVSDFSVFEGETAMYVASSHLPGGFNKQTPTQIQIKLHKFDGSSTKSKTIVSLALEASPALFPVHASTAVYKKKMMVCWQETNLKKGGTVIRYVFSENGMNAFGKVQTLTGTSKTAVLPQLKVDSAGRFHLFFQEEKGANRFTLMKSIGQNGVFAAPSAIVQEIRYIGRGVFFPSVVFTKKQVDLLYQNRLEASLRDEIFRITSKNNGLSYGSPRRLMTNKYNDFSPVAIHTKKGLEWVWQANPNKNWAIFYGNEKGDTRKITTTNANTYLPTIANVKNVGNIIAWYDTRVSPPQVFALFQDRVSNKNVGREHNVSQTKYKARKPILANLKGRVYLYYLVGTTLYSRLADTFSQVIKVSSKTHPSGVPKKSNRVKLKWVRPKDPSGIDSYAYLVDNSKKTEPEIFNLSGRKKSITFRNMAGGRYYFHILYRDLAGNLSPTSHYQFIINNVPPQEPIISSDTHQDRVASRNKSVRLQFKTGDDALVKKYHYAFSPNRAAKLKKTTKKRTLIFNDQAPNVYFFKVQAEDLSGNLSDVAVYQVEIAYADSEQVIISTNISEGRLVEPKLKFKIITAAAKRVKKAFLYVGPRYKDPFNEGKVIQGSYSKNEFKAEEALKIERGIYTASLGLEFADGSRSNARKYHFEKGKKKQVEVIAYNRRNFKQPRPKRTRQVKKTKQDATKKAKRKLGKKELKKLAKELKKQVVKPKIRVIDRKGLKEVSFSIPKKYKPLLKGYSWYLGRDPLRPDLTVNHRKGPIYLYDLPTQTHWLSVRPIFADKKLNKYKNRNYAYAQIKVRDGLWFLGGKFMVLYISLAIALVLAVLIALNKDRVIFYLSRLKTR